MSDENEIEVCPTVQRITVSTVEDGLLIQQPSFGGDDDDLVLVPLHHVEGLVSALRKAAKAAKAAGGK